MYQHNSCWNKALGTGIILIIILSIVIVAFHTAMADEQLNVVASSEKRCNINVQELQTDANVQITEEKKRDCVNGFDVKIRNPSQLSLLDKSLPIRMLNIEPESENTIDIEIFNEKPFDQLIELHLSDVNVYGSSDTDKKNSTLKLLSIHRSENRDLNALIHQFPVKSLEILDLSDNSIPNQLNRFFFVNMSNIHEIHLKNCQIQKFPFDTFLFVYKTIQLIDLTGNNLMKLPTGFSSIFPEQILSNQLTVRFDNNPWMCKCTKENLAAELNCLENCRMFSGRGLNDINDKADDVIELQCEDLSDSSKTELVLLKKQTHNITIEPKGESLLGITVTGPKDAYLIWYNDSFAFNSNNEKNIADYMHCNDRPKFELAVSQNSTYTFCVLTSNLDDAISPFNCVAYYVNPKSSNSINPELVWITNGQKGMVYAIVITSILLLMIFGILLGIFLIRKYPHLLKERHSPYLIDNSNRFSKRNSCTSSSVFSVDDNNTMDYIPTYVSPKNFDFVKPPKENEVALDASRLENMKNQTTENQYDSTKLYWDNTQKLPLPPPTPNANENKTSKNEEENNFSDNISKECDKQIDLPMSLDSPNQEDDDKETVYTECKFDEIPKQDD